MSDLLLIQNENKILKRELVEKDKNLQLAAQYGQDLLEQNADLHTKIEKTIEDCDHKIEKFQQEKYSLSIKLDTQERVVKTLSSEIESQEKLHNEKIKTLTQKMEGEITEFRKKVYSRETMIESLQKEITIHKEKSDNFQALFEQTEKEQQALLAISSDNGLRESTLEFEDQINSLRNDKQDLKKEVLELKSALQSASLNAKNKANELERTLVELEEKKCQLTSLFNEVERNKKENEELRMEIDQMKYAETDPQKKGNSLFAELEDNRQALEKQVLSVTSKLATAKKQCEVKAQQITKLRLHIASLLNMTNSRADLQYQQHLEESLAFTKDQFNNIVLKCKELETKLQKQSSSHDDCGMNFVNKLEVDNFLRHHYEDSLAKVASLEEELQDLCFTKVSLNDKILQLRRKLHQSEWEIDSNRAEIIRLNVKIEELTSLNKVTDAAEPDKEVKLQVFIERLPSNEACQESEAEDADDDSKLESNMKEKYIMINVQGEYPAKDSTDAKSSAGVVPSVEQTELPRSIVEMERKNPHFLRGNLKLQEEVKSVTFRITENGEKRDPCAAEFGQMPKLRKKMEAPHIEVTQAPEQTECKLQ